MTEAATSATERVLVVDDEEIIATTLTAILIHNGFEARFALSAEDALLVARDFRPDILLTDLVMPGGKDGVELIRNVRRAFPGCRAILITGQASVLPKLPKFANIHIVEKPIAPADLIAILRGHDIPMQPARPTTVLVVEDQEIKRYSVARLLLHSGFQVLEAATGAEALARAREPLDCLLLDVNLPDMDGFAVCRQLRAAEQTMPILHFTATRVDAAAAAESKRAGADAYISQPIEPEELLRTIRSFIQLRYLQEELRRPARTRAASAGAE